MSQDRVVRKFNFGTRNLTINDDSTGKGIGGLQTQLTILNPWPAMLRDAWNLVFLFFDLVN